jgi:hypothetical protein
MRAERAAEQFALLRSYFERCRHPTKRDTHAADSDGRLAA